MLEWPLRVGFAQAAVALPVVRGQALTAALVHRPCCSTMIGQAIN